MIIALQALIFFRQSILTVLDQLLRPYYKHFSLSFSKSGDVSEDEESEEQVFADYDDDKGVVFYPPMYAQRYAAVSDCLMDERWCGKLEKVVDLGYHDMSFIKYLKEVPGVKDILGVDLESIPLRCSSDLLSCDDYAPKREHPLQITLFQGNAADPDYRLIGCDAVIGIEMIEHMLPHDLDRLVHTVFGFIKPRIAIFTTPNGDFNVLFKSLEKNGLRRLDHFFEWSKVQFNDWCSNIVARYPQYTVSYKGIGPGPPDTLHIGCCSQLALFVAKDYHKQVNLTFNSLALVQKVPSPNTLSDVLGGWDSPSPRIENNMLCSRSNLESYTDFLISDNNSRLTIVIASPTFSVASLEYRDVTSQCNLDSEYGKGFLMFDHGSLYNVLEPRRKIHNRVYEIEDVTSRLNCTTLQVTKFSKTTQNMMAKNKLDSLVHTREVVDEIRHLTKMLNFNKDNLDQHEAETVWCNINWGENAPYWNQYYTIVREFNYPFETKSDQSRILDLISDEINRLIDLQYDEEFSVDVNKLEIPIYHLMRVVKHITDDVEMVKELLDWNGYEVVDDVVIHSRVVLDSGSLLTHDEDWPDNDTYSDWDNTTEIHSTSMSDGSTILPDINGRCLRRALDHKVRKLRSMLTADEDITTELDRVVCRLMKLALRTSKGRQTPPPTRWMQCKLLDLLTLTEKAIDRRKKHFIEKYPLKAISYDYEKDQRIDLLALKNIRSDDTVKKIVDKYQHLVNAPVIEKKSRNKYRFIDWELEDDLSVTSTEDLKEYEYIETTKTPSPLPIHLKEPTFEPIDENKLERTQAWVDEDLEVVPYPNHDNSSGDTDHSVSNDARYRFKRFSKRHKISSDNKKNDELISKLSKRSKSRILYDKFNKLKQDERNKTKTSNTRISKKAARGRPSANNLFKNSSSKLISIEYGYYGINFKRKKKNDQQRPTAANPIPENLMHLCHSNYLEDKKIVNEFYSNLTNDSKEVIEIVNTEPSFISATENSCMITIVMEGLEETIALQRTIGTDADDPIIENEMVIGSISAVDDDGFCPPDTPSENVQSQTIFLNDINEPSTSKGIRHTSMDVQCGPDATVPAYSALSATTSLTKTPAIFSTGIKIGDSITDMRVKQFEFGTSTNDYDNLYKTITPRIRSIGIRIQDSDVNISRRAECSTMTQAYTELQASVITPRNVASGTETKLLKPFTNNLEFEESCSDVFESVEGSQKSPFNCASSPKNTSDVLIECSGLKDECFLEKITAKKYVRPKLSRGGIHIHSYKDKQVSEDVIYQGEWQRHKSKLCAKKKVYNPVIARKVTDASVKKLKANSKERVSNRNAEKTARTQLKIPVRSRAPKIIKGNHEPTDQVPSKMKCVPANVLKTKFNKNISKAASKIIIGPISSKITKSSLSTKKTAISASVAVKKDSENPQKPPKYIRQSYLPSYLRKRTLPPTNCKTNLNKSIDAVRVNREKQPSPLMRSKTEEINKGLMKLRNLPPHNVSYVVFRNELENKKSGSTDNEAPALKETPRKRQGSAKRPQSPQSPNSSTCSSPSSVATVRAVSTRPKITSNRRHSASSNKNSMPNSESENTTPNKNKKFTKRQKTAKKTDDKEYDNKENIPQSSVKLGSNKNSDKTSGKNVFISARHKNIYMAQLSKDSSHIQSSLNNSKQLPNKSNVRIPTVESKDEIIRISQSDSKKEKFISDTSLGDYCIAGKSDDSSALSNMVLVLEPHDSKLPMSETPVDNMSVVEINAVIENNILTQWVNSSNNIVSSHTSYVIDAMRQLVEETLDFIDALDCYESIDSETVILSRDENKLSSLNVSLSPSSYKANEEHDMNALVNEIEATFNRTFDSHSGEIYARFSNYMDTRLIGNDDNLSFQSANSESKLSEYFTFESDLENPKPSIKAITPVSGSVQGIYERKDQCPLPDPHGALAIQAFSGFSINGEPVSGDQPDHVNLVDSETGSLAVGIARQTTSEELFISGRSSGSYESCLMDDDAVVPSWLFRIISQQQAVEEEEEAPEMLIPLPIAMPPQEPMFDVNGNILETGAGVGAGAGDGRGIHSDHSQDSSGRGTSLSSSDMSSGPQSEAILIDPSAFTAQFEFLRESVGSTIGVANDNGGVEPVQNTYRVEGVGLDSEAMSSNREESARRRQVQAAASDADADVSSLDTDVPDSSDN